LSFSGQSERLGEDARRTRQGFFLESGDSFGNHKVRQLRTKRSQESDIDSIELRVMETGTGIVDSNFAEDPNAWKLRLRFGNAAAPI
jgi:hypothetical protein